MVRAYLILQNTYIELTIMVPSQPVQRVPRYILLLDALVSRTPAAHPDHTPLCQALDAMKRFTEAANQEQRTYERYQAILRIHELLYPQIPVRPLLRISWADWEVEPWCGS